MKINIYEVALVAVAIAMLMLALWRPCRRALEKGRKIQKKRGFASSLPGRIWFELWRKDEEGRYEFEPEQAGFLFGTIILVTLAVFFLAHYFLGYVYFYD